jgi:nicotinamide riboside kinase
MVKKIVITGPESSGKTTLATQLAARLNTIHVPEFARTYLTWLGRPYQNSDLTAIFNGQIAWEHWYASKANEYLICDTDWTVMDIWRRDRGLTGVPVSQQSPWHLAVLCTPDFDWQPDPLREHPTQRWDFFQRYQQLLEQQGWPFLIVAGSVQLRLQTIIESIETVNTTQY